MRSIAEEVLPRCYRASRGSLTFRPVESLAGSLHFPPAHAGTRRTRFPDGVSDGR